MKSSGKKQFGRSVRHKDVTRCSIGAFGFYLLARFTQSGEMDAHRPNFFDNSSWFDIKIITAGKHEGNTEEFGKRTYITMIKSIFKKLNIQSAHFGHWGRVSGPIELEFMEIDQEFIRQLGKWGLLICLLF